MLTDPNGLPPHNTLVWRQREEYEPVRELTAARFAGGVFCGEVAADLDRLADLSVEPLDHIEVGNALAKTGETPSL